MNSMLRKLLKPIFATVASPGLGNPHAAAEAELMAAGVKPTAIMGPEEVTAEMQALIDSGQIVKIAEHEFENTFRIYHHPREADRARRGAEILQKFHEEKKGLSEEDVRFLSNFLEQPIDSSPVAKQSIRLLADSFSHEQVQSMLDGKMTALPSIRYSDEPTSRNEDLEKALAEKRIGAADFKDKVVVAVYAQADKVEEGRELNSRYYLNGEGYEPLSHEDTGRRVGQLLGYTDNDLAWASGQKYGNPAILYLMEKTDALRHWARKEVMLSDAPRPP